MITDPVVLALGALMIGALVSGAFLVYHVVIKDIDKDLDWEDIKYKW